MRVKFFAASIMIFVWLLYFSYFNHWDDIWDIFDSSKWSGFPNTKSDWGTFGDFFGGVLNPVLSFISIVMLINSIKLQREANSSLIEDSKRQSKLEDKRSFEVSFYNLIEAERDEFKEMEITLPSGTFKNVKAVNELENYISTYIEDNKATIEEVASLLEKIDDDSGLVMFSVVRGFYVLTKLINDNCPEDEKNHYIDICVSLMPVKAINIVVMAAVYFKWANVTYMKSNFPEFFERPSIKNTMDSIRGLHGAQH
jgi:hypothetical protein